MTIFGLGNFEFAVTAGVIVEGIVLIAQSQGYDPLEFLGLRKKSISRGPSGIPSLEARAERPTIIEVSPGYNVVYEGSALKDGSANWIIDARGYGQIDGLPWNETVRKGELVLNDSAPGVLLASNALFLKYIKGGISSAKDAKINELTQMVQWMDGQLAKLESELRIMSMSDEARLKIKEAVKGIELRERFRKNNTIFSQLNMGGTGGAMGNENMMGDMGGT